MKRYAAKLLFQYRVVRHGLANTRRVCEEKIVTTCAENAREALAGFKRLAKTSEYSYVNCCGGKVFVEFVGVLELLHLFGGNDQEVWYDMRERFKPMERKAKLIPREATLSAIYWEKNTRKRAGHLQHNYRPLEISRGPR